MDTIVTQIKKDLSFLEKKQPIFRAVRFNEEIREKFIRKYEFVEENSLPLYFTGKLDSKIVMVEFNPLPGMLNLDDEDLNSFLETHKINIYNWEGYRQFCENFGTYKKFVKDKKGSSLGKYDNKQLDFYAGLGLFPYKKKFTLNDLESLRNNKLQLELFPYSSDRFDFNLYSHTALKTQVDSLFDVITQVERTLIFITGKQKVVNSLFKGIDWIKDGQYSIGFFDQDVNGRTIKLCFIPSYKSYSVSSSKYGEFCRQHIG